MEYIDQTKSNKLNIFLLALLAMELTLPLSKLLIWFLTVSLGVVIFLGEKSFPGSVRKYLKILFTVVVASFFLATFSYELIVSLLFAIVIYLAGLRRVAFLSLLLLLSGYELYISELSSIFGEYDYLVGISFVGLLLRFNKISFLITLISTLNAYFQLPVSPTEFVLINFIITFLILVNLLPNDEKFLHLKSLIATAFMCVLSFNFLWGLEKEKELYVMLPEDDSKYESQYFSSYKAVLSWLSFEATFVKNFSDVPPDTILLLPWTTASLPNEKSMTEMIPPMGEGRRTYIYASEHTNMGGVKNRISSLFGVDRINDDLSSPYKNRDFIQGYRSRLLFPIPKYTAINRGSTLKRTHGVMPLIQVDDWWSEPNLNEWLWVGDYIWSEGDVVGRLELATHEKIGNERLIVVGDNSFLLQDAILASPGQLKQFLRNTNINWLVYKDGVILMLIAVFLFGSNAAALMLLGVLLLCAIALRFIGYQDLDDERWTSNHEHMFSPTGINKKLALLINEIPTISLFRDEFREEFLTDNSLSILGRSYISKGEVPFIDTSSCFNLGGITLPDGPRLMDSTACRVTSDVEVLLGSRDEAVVVRKSGMGIFIFDAEFLANKSPVSNYNWLIENIR